MKLCRHGGNETQQSVSGSVAASIRDERPFEEQRDREAGNTAQDDDVEEDEEPSGEESGGEYDRHAEQRDTGRDGGEALASPNGDASANDPRDLPEEEGSSNGDRSDPPPRIRLAGETHPRQEDHPAEGATQDELTDAG